MMAEESQSKSNLVKKYLTVNIFSPQGEVYSNRAYACRVHSVDGWLTILPDHLPLLTVLDIGAVVVTRLGEGNQDHIAINGGALTFHDNVIDIAATYAIRASDIDEARVKILKNQAEADMQEALNREDKSSYRRAQIALNRALNQIKVSAQRK